MRLKDEIPGISKIEYEGHFGPNVFFTLDDEDNNEETRNKITEIIQEFIS